MKSDIEILTIAKGEKVELFSRSFSSVPMTYEFKAEAKSSEHLSGTIEIETKQSLFRKPKRFLKVEENNVIKATMWDTFVRVYVVAYSDMQISIPKRKLASRKLIFGLVIFVVVLSLITMLPVMISAMG